MKEIEDKTFHILCVDDTKTNLILVKNILDKQGYKISTASCGQEAIEYLQKNPHIDLILLDVMMPNLDGYKVAQILKRSKTKVSKIPIIFLTAVSDKNGIAKCYDVGGVDYISKPFVAHELIMRVKNHIKLKYVKDMELEKAQNELIYMMSELSDKHCEVTKNHVKRVAEYSCLMARLLGYDEQRAKMIKLAAAMHDVGKVTIPDAILKSEKNLSKDDFEIMKQHAQNGYDILKKSDLPLMKLAATVAHQHHEMYDGTGYPRGLKGEQIHIIARIVALADVFDALVSPRGYKKGWHLNDVFSFFKSKRGKHFDPRIVDLLMDNFGAFLEIEERYRG